MPVMYAVAVRGDFETSDFDTLAEAKQHALYVAAKRQGKALRYAAGSIESMQAGGWAAPVDVVRRTYKTTASGVRLLDPKTRRVFTTGK